MSDKPIIHQSEAEMLLGCGLQYEARYVRGDIRPPHAAVVTGTAVHAAVADDLRAKIASGALLDAADVADLAGSAYDGAWMREEPRLLPYEQARGAEAVRGEGKDRAVRLALLHHEQLAPALRPTHVERSFVLHLDDLPMDYAGTLDVQEGAGAIRDTKTSRRKPDVDEADRSLQLTGYALGVSALDGKAPETVALDYLVDATTPRALTLESTRGPADFATFIELLGRLARVIETGLFLPAPRKAWWCSADWCGWFADCPFGARHRTAAAIPIPIHGA